jgi:hypothetical protein
MTMAPCGLIRLIGAEIAAQWMGLGASDEIDRADFIE